MSRYSGKRCRIASMFSLTTVFFLVEIIVGYVTNSMALVADSFHMLSDIVALIIAFLSIKVSKLMLLYSTEEPMSCASRTQPLGTNVLLLSTLCF